MVRTLLSFLWTDINIIDPLPHLEKLRLRAKIPGWAEPVAPCTVPFSSRCHSAPKSVIALPRQAPEGVHLPFT